MAIDKTMELLDLQDAQSATFRVTRWEAYKGTIKTTKEPDGKEIDVLRVYVDPADKKHGLPWYDITAKTLVAQLTPLLDTIVAQRRYVNITKRGVAPMARYSVEVR
jgi:hypothetical protein